MDGQQEHRPESESGALRLPRGRQWYDPLNGLRIGALAGAIAGAVVTALWRAAGVWPVVILSVAGGAAGYWWERRSIARQAAADLER